MTEHSQPSRSSFNQNPTFSTDNELRKSPIAIDQQQENTADEKSIVKPACKVHSNQPNNPVIGIDSNFHDHIDVVQVKVSEVEQPTVSHMEHEAVTIKMETEQSSTETDSILYSQLTKATSVDPTSSHLVGHHGNRPGMPLTSSSSHDSGLRQGDNGPSISTYMAQAPKRGRFHSDNNQCHQLPFKNRNKTATSQEQTANVNLPTCITIKTEEEEFVDIPINPPPRCSSHDSLSARSMNVVNKGVQTDHKHARRFYKTFNCKNAASQTWPTRHERVEATKSKKEDTDLIAKLSDSLKNIKKELAACKKKLSTEQNLSLDLKKTIIRLLPQQPFCDTLNRTPRGPYSNLRQLELKKLANEQIIRMLYVYGLIPRMPSTSVAIPHDFFHVLFAALEKLQSCERPNILYKLATLICVQKEDGEPLMDLNRMPYALVEGNVLGLLGDKLGYQDGYKKWLETQLVWFGEHWHSLYNGPKYEMLPGEDDKPWKPLNVTLEMISEEARNNARKANLHQLYTDWSRLCSAVVSETNESTSDNETPCKQCENQRRQSQSLSGCTAKTTTSKQSSKKPKPFYNVIHDVATDTLIYLKPIPSDISQESSPPLVSISTVESNASDAVGHALISPLDIVSAPNGHKRAVGTNAHSMEAAAVSHPLMSSLDTIPASERHRTPVVTNAESMTSGAKSHPLISSLNTVPAPDGHRTAVNINAQSMTALEQSNSEHEVVGAKTQTINPATCVGPPVSVDSTESMMEGVTDSANDCTGVALGTDKPGVSIVTGQDVTNVQTPSSSSGIAESIHSGMAGHDQTVTQQAPHTTARNVLGTPQTLTTAGNQQVSPKPTLGTGMPLEPVPFIPPYAKVLPIGTKLPPGAKLLPQGATLVPMPPGTKLLPPGTRIFPAGTKLPPGAKLLPQSANLFASIGKELPKNSSITTSTREPPILLTANNTAHDTRPGCSSPQWIGATGTWTPPGPVLPSVTNIEPFVSNTQLANAMTMTQSSNVPPTSAKQFQQTYATATQSPASAPQTIPMVQSEMTDTNRNIIRIFRERQNGRFCQTNKSSPPQQPLTPTVTCIHKTNAKKNSKKKAPSPVIPGAENTKQFLELVNKIVPENLDDFWKDPPNFEDKNMFVSICGPRTEQVRLNAVCPIIAKKRDMISTPSNSTIQDKLLLELHTLNPNARWWVKVGSFEIKHNHSLRYSVDGDFIGDEDIGDGAIPRASEIYRKRKKLVQGLGLGKRNTAATLKHDMSFILETLQGDNSYLVEELRKTREKRGVYPYENSGREIRFTHDDKVEAEIRHCNRLLERNQDLMERLEAALEQGKNARIKTLRTNLLDYTTKITTKKRTLANWILFFMISDEMQHAKPYSWPVRNVYLESISSDMVGRLRQQLIYKMTKLNMNVVGCVNDEWTDHLALCQSSCPSQRPVFIKEVIDEARQEAATFHISELTKYFTAVEWYSPSCELQLVPQWRHAAISQDDVYWLYRYTQNNNASVLDGLRALHKHILPNVESPHPWNDKNGDPSIEDEYRSLMAIYLYRHKIATLASQGIDFTRSLYVPAIDPVTKHAMHVKESTQTLFKNVSREAKEDSNLPSEEKPKLSLLFDAWYKASVNKHWSVAKRREANHAILQYVLKDWLPSPGMDGNGINYTYVDVNRPMEESSFMAGNILTSLIINIESDNQLNSDRPNPWASSNQDVIMFTALLRHPGQRAYDHRHLQSASLMKSLCTEFYKAIDPDLEFHYFWTDKVCTLHKLLLNLNDLKVKNVWAKTHPKFAKKRPLEEAKDDNEIKADEADLAGDASQSLMDMDWDWTVK